MVNTFVCRHTRFTSNRLDNTSTLVHKIYITTISRGTLIGQLSADYRLLTSLSSLGSHDLHNCIDSHFEATDAFIIVIIK